MGEGCSRRCCFDFQSRCCSGSCLAVGQCLAMAFSAILCTPPDRGPGEFGRSFCLAMVGYPKRIEETLEKAAQTESCIPGRSFLSRM